MRSVARGRTRLQPQLEARRNRCWDTSSGYFSGKVPGLLLCCLSPHPAPVARSSLWMAVLQKKAAQFFGGDGEPSKNLILLRQIEAPLFFFSQNWFQTALKIQTASKIQLSVKEKLNSSWFWQMKKSSFSCLVWLVASLEFTWGMLLFPCLLFFFFFF